MKLVAKPWEPQDLLNDLQDMIDEEPDEYLNTGRTTLLMAKAFLSEHFAEPKWTPVTEQLPERGQEVIAFSGGYLKPTVFATQFWSPDYISWQGITHWKPMPDPPREM